MICLPITHKHTVRKIVKLAYGIDTRYGVMAELLFSFGYRGCDIISLRKKDVCFKNIDSLYLKESKNSTRRLFQTGCLSDVAKRYVNELELSMFLFPSDKKYYKGKNNHVTLRHVRRVFKTIFSTIPQLYGALGLHVFRKTFAYNIYKKRGDIYAVQLALGHKNIQSTVHYLPQEVIL